MTCDPGGYCDLFAGVAKVLAMAALMWLAMMAFVYWVGTLMGVGL